MAAAVRELSPVSITTWTPMPLQGVHGRPSRKASPCRRRRRSPRPCHPQTTIIAVFPSSSSLASSGSSAERSPPFSVTSRLFPSRTVFPSTVALTPFPAIASKSCGSDMTDRAALRLVDDGLAQRVLRPLLDRGREAQELVLS